MTADVLAELRKLVPLDPEHLPGEILLQSPCADGSRPPTGSLLRHRFPS